MNRLVQFLTLIIVVIASFIFGLLYRDWIAQSKIPPRVEQYLTSLFCSQPQATYTLVSKAQPTTAVAKPKPTPTLMPPRANFSGPELFDAINDRRVQYGVGSLSHNDQFCSLASFRLNQLLPTGTLDNHSGFVAVSKDPNSPYADLFNQYNIAEFLVFIPYGTATDAISAWDNTLGHKILLNGGQFTVGCAYAQRGIAVALAGY